MAFNFRTDRTRRGRCSLTRPLAVVFCAWTAGCAAHGALPEQIYIQAPKPSQRLPLTIAFVPTPAQDYRVGDIEISWEPGLSNAFLSMLQGDFEEVDSKSGLMSSGRAPDLVASSTSTIAFSPQGPTFSLKVSFTDPNSLQTVTEETVTGAIQLRQPNATETTMLAMTIVLAPLAIYQANQDAVGNFVDSAREQLPPLFEQLSEQITKDQRLASFAPSRKKLVEVEGAEQAGEIAESKGRLPEALSDYVSGIKALPSGQSGVEADYELRQRAISLAARMNPPPAPSEEYRREMTIGLTAIKEAHHPEDYRQALDHFAAASNAAPWAPQPYYNLGLVWEQLGDNASAARYYRLCLLAVPSGPDAAKVRDRIASLKGKTVRPEGTAPASGQ
jgi:hypothetical protein